MRAKLLARERLQEIEERLAAACRRSGRERAEVTLVAVSKRQPDEAVRALAGLGVCDFGENLVQPWLGRIATLGDLAARWHVIGPLQTKKARSIAAGQPFLVHTVDRPRLVAALASHWDAPEPLEVLIQVNVDREPQKAGCPPEGVGGLADLVAATPCLRLRGLMCIPRPPAAGPPSAAFAATRRLAEAISDRASGPLIVSMGMSSDFEEAIGAGSTLVRVGTALFGPRPS